MPKEMKTGPDGKQYRIYTPPKNLEEIGADQAADWDWNDTPDPDFDAALTTELAKHGIIHPPVTDDKATPGRIHKPRIDRKYG